MDGQGKYFSTIDLFCCTTISNYCSAMKGGNSNETMHNILSLDIIIIITEYSHKITNLKYLTKTRSLELDNIWYLKIFVFCF